MMYLYLMIGDMWSSVHQIVYIHHTYYYYYYYYVLERKGGEQSAIVKMAFLSAEAPEAPEATESQPTEVALGGKLTREPRFRAASHEVCFLALRQAQH